MRWFSGLAILFYLSLLCTPQVFAVHDANVSPLADSQLQAVQPGLQQHLQSQKNDNEDNASAVLLAVAQQFTLGKTPFATTVRSFFQVRHLSKAWQARAPPNALTF